MSRRLGHPLYPGGKEPETVALVGDLHGNTTAARNAIEKAVGFAPLLIQLGDFGWWRPGRDTDRYIGALNRQLAFYELTLLWLDGNHEDFESLYKIPIDPVTGLRKVTNRIWHLPRSYRWRWAGKTWMALGGAVSVDKQSRREGLDWWPEEVITEDDFRGCCTDL